MRFVISDTVKAMYKHIDNIRGFLRFSVVGEYDAGSPGTRGVYL